AYDGIRLLATAIGNPGTLTQNLANLDAVRGVQGELSTSELLVGELSNNVAVTELGAFGAPELIVRYSGNTMVVDTEDEEPIATQVAQATFTPAPTATPDSPYLVVTRAVQNVRSGPGLNYDIIGQLQEGDTAQVIGANIDFSWVVISFRGGQGWLSRGILDLFGNVNQIPIIAPPPTPTPPPATATPTAEPFADVVIVGVTPNRLVIGQPFTVTVTVRNQGALAAGGFAIAATFEPGSVYAAVNLPGLAPGQQANVTLTGLLTGATGPRNVVIVADLNNQVNEGIAGEANNDDYIYSYVADNSTLTPGGLGSITLAPGSTINLDGSTDDLLWTGTDLVAQNGAQIYLLSGFTSLDQIHYDVISTTTNASPINVTLLTNAFIGLRTDTGNQKRGVIRVDGAISGGNLTIAYRVYN
ncbi:MAG: SH3 domain-containing protein, partial [Anaerolineae bacterium]|nr:SH3 domain-containing protein [Anaerolineae bacterium]